MKPQLRQRLKEVAKDVMKEDAEYQQFFKSALEKSGKSIPEMSDEEKKVFFNKIDAAWDAKGEKRETNEDVAAELPSANIPSNVKTKLLQAIQQISNAKLSFNQKIQVIAQVVDSLGIDKSELSKIDSRLKSKMVNTTESKKSVKLKESVKKKITSEAKFDKSITEMGTGDIFFKKIMKLYDTGGDFTKKKVASAVCENPKASRDSIEKELRNADHDIITKYADKLQIESVIKEGNGNLAKVGDLIDLPAKPSYQAKAGIYVLVSINKNPNGHYMYEFVRNNRIVIFGEYELKAILMKELTQSKKNLVKESVSQSDLNKIKQIVQDHVDAGGKFIGLGDKLKKSFKTDFSTAMGTPMFTIKLGSNIFAILNKKYVDDADFTIGDIAGGTL